MQLFEDVTYTLPKTIGIKYTGSKLKMLPYIFQAIEGLEIETVLDGFSGTTRVSQSFAANGFATTASDIAEWSETFGKCFLLNKLPVSHYLPIIKHLNSLKGYDGWFTEHYGGDTSDSAKRPFQRKNTRKVDAIREEIDRIGLDDIEKSVILTSLIFALDAVDSTLGHYVAYLANWSPRSYNDLHLKVPPIKVNVGNHRVLKGDIFETIKNNEFDLAYFDPPYGSNNEKMPPSRVRYSSYYHIWTTIIKNDKPKTFGKANRREDTRDAVSSSVFEEFRRDEKGRFIAMNAIKKLLQETKAGYILLSYSSGGRATKEQLIEIINASGKLLKVESIDYKHNVMSGMRWTNAWINSDGKHQEYLFLMAK